MGRLRGTGIFVGWGLLAVGMALLLPSGRAAACGFWDLHDVTGKRRARFLLNQVRGARWPISYQVRNGALRFGYVGRREPVVTVQPDGRIRRGMRRWLGEVRGEWLRLGQRRLRIVVRRREEMAADPELTEEERHLFHALREQPWRLRIYDEQGRKIAFGVPVCMLDSQERDELGGLDEPTAIRFTVAGVLAVAPELGKRLRRVAERAARRAADRTPPQDAPPADRPEDGEGATRPPEERARPEERDEAG